MNSSKNKQVKKKKSRRTSDSERHVGFSGILKSSLLGALIGIAAAFVLILIGAFFCYSSDDYDKLLLPVSIAAMYISSLIGGFCASKKQGGSALLCGSISGAVIMLFFLICSFALKNTADASFGFPLSLLLRALIIIAGIIGGYLGLMKKTQRKRKR